MSQSIRGLAEVKQPVKGIGFRNRFLFYYFYPRSNFCVIIGPLGVAMFSKRFRPNAKTCCLNRKMRALSIIELMKRTAGKNNDAKL